MSKIHEEIQHKKKPHFKYCRYRKYHKSVSQKLQMFKFIHEEIQTGRNPITNIADIENITNIFFPDYKAFTECSTTIIIDTFHRIIAFFVYFKLVPITHSLSEAPLSQFIFIKLSPFFSDGSSDYLICIILRYL